MTVSMKGQVQLMQGSYTVEHYQYGMVIRGPLPIDDFGALTEAAKKRGFDILDAGIGAHLGGTAETNSVMVLASKESSAAWRAEIEQGLRDKYPDEPELQWVYGCDTGTSSLTIFLTLKSTKRFLPWEHMPPHQDFLPGVPHDPDDFGRCYRLLELFPEWRERLAEVAAKYPMWQPFVVAWPGMEALWREESPSGECPKLYEVLKAIKLT